MLNYKNSLLLQIREQEASERGNEQPEKLHQPKLRVDSQPLRDGDELPSAQSADNVQQTAKGPSARVSDLGGSFRSGDG